MKIEGMLLLALVFSGCATGPEFDLKPGSERVQAVEYINPEGRAKLREMTMITCDLGKNARSAESNVESCKNKLRNEAQALGGTLILLEPEKQKLGQMADTLTGPQYCPNCVTLRAIVFGPKKP